VQFLIIMVLMLGVMYVLMIRPQRQRQAQQQAMIDGASVGDDILTSGGIYGTITEVEGDDVVVEIARGVTVHMTRRGIAAVLPPEEEESEEAEEDGGEGVVTEGEEAVRSAVGDAPSGDDRR
jgi:preprotein translocase subunit YajC